MKKKKTILGLAIIILIIGITIIYITTQNYETIETSSTNLSNKKIGWGIKRNDNH